jgi:outer membrane receptor for ferrienterochelin and colicins
MFKNICVALFATATSISLAFAQNSTQQFKIIDTETQEALIGATVQITELDLGTITNLEGNATLNVPNGSFEILVQYVGYIPYSSKVNMPTQNVIVIELEADVEALEEVIISITRTGRTIDKVPTRVEIIDAEELVEKAVMNSANIGMLLKESTGIQMQQTSAASGNKSIRIQGLDGRHTQIVKDGFALFGGFSGGLSIMQIPPLDLQRVEVIKGSSSTLYGGGAIAGLVNLVTRKPSEGRVFDIMLDQTSALRTTANVFYSDQKGKLGWTLYSSGNSQKVYDVNNDDFSEIPKTKGITINPSLFWQIKNNTKLRLSVNSAFENRIGGDVQVVNGTVGPNHTYFEDNSSSRVSYQLNLDHRLSDSKKLTFKNSISYFDRSIDIPNYSFEGSQTASFSEISYAHIKEDSEWVLGGNFYTDNFDETLGLINQRDYSNNTVGAFSQYNKDLSSKIVGEAGLRVDHNSKFGTFFLPRVSFLFKLNENLSSRLGGAYGYKTPTIFTEDTESISFEGVQPLSSNLLSEESRGLNLDFNYSKSIGENWTLSVNQFFFYTQLDNSLVLREPSAGSFLLENANGPVNSRGFETNMKLTYKDFKLFANYALINTRLNYDNINQQKPLTAKHNIGGVLVYEVEDKWRVGYELYYTGKQFRTDFTETQDFAEMGLMIMRTLKKITLYINFENFTDTRQSKFEDVTVATHANPGFREIWSPVEGRVINGGFILKL